MEQLPLQYKITLCGQIFIFFVSPQESDNDFNGRNFNVCKKRKTSEGYENPSLIRVKIQKNLANGTKVDPGTLFWKSE